MRPGNIDPLLLTTAEAAKALQIPRPKIYDLIREQLITGYKIGSDWRIERASVERLLTPCSTISPYEQPNKDMKRWSRWN